MKTHAHRVILTAAAAALSLTTARAVDGVWTNKTGGSWSIAANWEDQAVPGGIGSVITLQTPIATTSLDAPFTVGRLVVDLTAGGTINPGSGGSLTFDNGADMPEFQMFPVTSNQRVWINTPLHGTNGLLVCTKTTGNAFWQVYAPGTISGDLILSNNVIGQVLHNTALGTATVTLTPGSQMRFNYGVASANNIIMKGGTLYGSGYSGANSPININGTITFVSSATFFAGGDGTPTLNLNGPIIAPDDPGVGVSFFAGVINLNSPLTVNGSSFWNSNSGDGAVLVHQGVRLNVNAPLAWSDNGRFNFRTGCITCGAANVFNTTNYIWFNPSNETTYGHEFNLNGSDQRVGGLHGGANSGGATLISKITNSSATPATLTLDIPQTSSCSLANKSTIRGNFTVVKKGGGAQTFSTTADSNIVNQWIVENGVLTLNSGVFSANAAVRGGTLNGTATLRFRIDGKAHDAVVLASGALDVSKMSAEFTGFPDYGEHLIFDASAAGATFTGANTDTAPFYSITGLPEGCKLRTSFDKKKIWLVRPRPGALLLVK